MHAPTPGGADAGYGMAAPTPGGFTPGIDYGGAAATPGGFAPDPYSSYTPGTVPPALTPGVPYTPAATPGYVDPAALAGGMPGAPGGGDRSRLPPNYDGVVVLLPGGGEGVAGPSGADGTVPVTPLAGGAPVAVPLEQVRLAAPAREQWVRCVVGAENGVVGKVVSVQPPEAVLRTLGSGTMLLVLSRLGRLADQEKYQAQAEQQQQ